MVSRTRADDASRDPSGRAVVTVTYNSLAHLETFLASVRAELGDAAEVVVVDNGSRDLEALDELVARHGGRLIASDRNLGYGGAINLGVRSLAASATRILLSNPDIVIHPGALSQLVAALDELPEAGAVGPRVLNPDGTIYPSARNLPSLRTGVGHALLGRVRPQNRWTRAYHSDTTRSVTPTETGWLSGSCLLVDRAAFDAIGGFDDAFFMYFEDVDLGYRLLRAGWRNYYVPTAEVTHAGGHSTQDSSAQMVRVHHASAYRYMQRKYRGWMLAPLRLILRVGLSARAAWLTRRG